jgi:hypothetical protein
VKGESREKDTGILPYYRSCPIIGLQIEIVKTSQIEDFNMSLPRHRTFRV